MPHAGLNIPRKSYKYRAFGTKQNCEREELILDALTTAYSHSCEKNFPTRVDLFGINFART